MKMRKCEELADIRRLDFGQAAFHLGAESHHCNGRWTQLSADDLTVLYRLLQVSGAVHDSPALKGLAEFCAEAAVWSRNSQT